MKHTVAAGTARTLARLAKLRGAGGTSLPGLAALRIDPKFIQRKAKSLGGSVVVTGTNGKTTTARFISQAFMASGRAVVSNPTGANLLRGIASTLARRRARSAGKPWGVFEVDEATMPAACVALQPRIVVVTNLFRDQLDRYGELKRTAEYLREGLATLPHSSTAVLNADDPLVASLGKGLRCKVRYFGIEDTSQSRPRLPHAADSVSDPKSGALLRYSAVFVGHLGHYRGSSLRRPKPQVRLTRFQPDGPRGSRLTVKIGRSRTDCRLRVPGLYNAYNALAAIAAADVSEVTAEKAAAAIAETAAVFGRQEAIAIGGREVQIGLIKNPTGANEMLRTLVQASEKKRFLILINDNFADGRDVSWLWDTDFEAMLPMVESVAVAGRRGPDMALRLKYAGLDPKDIKRYDSIGDALRRELARTPDGEVLHVLPTYTAMLELRRALTRAGHVEHYLD